MFVNFISVENKRKNLKNVNFIFYDVLVYFINIIFLLIFLKYQWRNTLKESQMNDNLIKYIEKNILRFGFCIHKYIYVYFGDLGIRTHVLIER